MSATPRPYPLLARLRYAYFEEGRELPIVENAWWEARHDGGRSLGTVIDAIESSRQPYRQRVHLRYGRDGRPLEMEITLSRPDGEGSARYSFEPDGVTVEGVWRELPFAGRTALPNGYRCAPHCLAADGMHFGAVPRGGRAIVPCYLVDPRRVESPLAGGAAAFTAEDLGEESFDLPDRPVRARRYRTAYAGAPDRPAEFWVVDPGYAVRMTALRAHSARFEIVCRALTLSGPGF